MSETIDYQKKRETILNRAKDYYKNNKEVLREKAKTRYKELSKEDKNIKREYERNRCKNMSEEDTERLKKYQKNYRKAKSLNLIKKCMTKPLANYSFWILVTFSIFLCALTFLISLSTFSIIFRHSS